MIQEQRQRRRQPINVVDTTAGILSSIHPTSTSTNTILPKYKKRATRTSLLSNNNRAGVPSSSLTTMKMIVRIIPTGLSTTSTTSATMMTSSSSQGSVSVTASSYSNHNNNNAPTLVQLFYKLLLPILLLVHLYTYGRFYTIHKSSASLLLRNTQTHSPLQKQDNNVDVIVSNDEGNSVNSNILQKYVLRDEHINTNNNDNAIRMDGETLHDSENMVVVDSTTNGNAEAVDVLSDEVTINNLTSNDKHFENNQESNNVQQPEENVVEHGDSTSSSKTTTASVSFRDHHHYHLQITSNRNNKRNIGHMTSTNNLQRQQQFPYFFIVADHRSGYDWLVQQILLTNQQNDNSVILSDNTNKDEVKVCISPLSIFHPKNQQLPRKMRQNQQQQQLLACDYLNWAFVRDSINDILSDNGKSNDNSIPPRCELSYLNGNEIDTNNKEMNDPLFQYLPTLCSFIQKIVEQNANLPRNNDNTTNDHPFIQYSEEVMAKIWIDTFLVSSSFDDSSIDYFSQCYCSNKNGFNKRQQERKQPPKHLFRHLQQPESGEMATPKLLKGLPIMSDWTLPHQRYYHMAQMLFGTNAESNDDENHDQNSKNDSMMIRKIIRLKRANVWNRYMENENPDIVLHARKRMKLKAAINSNSYHNIHEMDSIPKISLSANGIFEFSEWISLVDKNADEWIQGGNLSKTKPSPHEETLWIEYDMCRLNITDCMTSILSFLSDEGIRDHSESPSNDIGPSYDQSNINGIVVMNSQFKESNYTPNYFEYISNANEIIEALCVRGSCDAFVPSVPSFYRENNDIVTYEYKYTKLFHLIHERYPNKPVRTLHFVNNMETILMNDPNYLKIDDIGDHNVIETKWDVFIPTLEQLISTYASDSIVVLSNDEGQSMSLRIHNKSIIFEATVEFRDAYFQMTSKVPNSVILSSSHMNYAGSSEFMPQSFWQELAQKSSSSTSVYPDGVFAAGTAQNLLNFIRELRTHVTERTQSISNDDLMLHKYIYRNPDKVVIDYDHRMFTEGFIGTCPKDSDKEKVKRASEKDDRLLFVHNGVNEACVHESQSSSGEFPIWGDGPHTEKSNVIDIDVVIDHIDTLRQNHTAILRNVQPYFGPEILYVVDSQGIWSSSVERDEFRIKPTDKLLLLAHQKLIESVNDKRQSQRWRELQKVVKGAGFPYWAWYGDLKRCSKGNAIDRYGNKQSVPLFTTCAIVGCNYSFPTPAYMTFIDSQEESSGFQYFFNLADKQYPWESKERKVVWRGSLSESDPDKVFDSVRWRACRKVTDLSDGARKDLFDVGFTEIPIFLSDQINIDASLVGGLRKSTTVMTEFQKYLAVLDMDGNSWSSRFGSLLCYNSVTIKVEPDFVDHFYHDLTPWKHYVPVKSDLSDLIENVEFILDIANDRVARNMVNAANKWCAERFTQTELAHDMLDTWEAYIHMLNRHDENWIDHWEKKRFELFSGNEYSGMDLNHLSQE